MADVSKKTIEQVIEDKGQCTGRPSFERLLQKILGSELVFIVYPHTIALMNWPQLWAILFFFMLITLGIDSTVSLMVCLVHWKSPRLNLVWWSGINHHRSM
jgi:SNF family Na+-dependent transporter